VEFETRLCRTEGFAASIEKNVDNKIEIANTLNRRIETFVTLMLFSPNSFTRGLERMRLFSRDFERITTLC
jgi:hypothetical protein